jgi:putative spermidine/putrescine transport system ATP-binding protein
LAIDDVSFEVRSGEIVALLGPSGCGKSTVLRAIAGLIRPKAGRISVGDTDLSALPARSRGIGMVFQNYALFPHLTVAENVAYPLACRRAPRGTRRERVAEMLELVRLEGFATRLPRELSGGQQQRVAVARALAARPSLLLLDEPFGALDRALRFDLQVEMLRLQKALGITTLIVTHDQEEAQSLAGRLVLMNNGRIEQIDTPMAVYDRPRTLFVNNFIGQTNRLSGSVVEASPVSSTILLSTGALLALPRHLGFEMGSQVVVTCRPEHVRIVAKEARNSQRATVDVALPLGPTLIYDLLLADGTEIRTCEMRGPDTPLVSRGEHVFVEIDAARCHVFPADREAPSAGEEVSSQRGE